MERYKGTGEASKRGELEAIPARGTYDEKIGVPADFRDFAATLTVVAFADKSASATSPEALQELIDMRKASAAGIAKGIEIINAGASETEAEASIQKYSEVYDGTPHERLELDTGELGIMLADLKHLEAWKPPSASPTKYCKRTTPSPEALVSKQAKQEKSDSRLEES